MELLYVWVESYGNIRKQGFNFSPNYDFEVTKKDEEYTLIDKYEEEKKKGTFKEQPKGFFGDNISNITAIVGKNGSGKSTVLEIFNWRPLKIKDAITIFKNENEYYFATVDQGTPANLEIYFKGKKLKWIFNLEETSFIYYENIYNSQYEFKVSSYGNQKIIDIGLNKTILRCENKIKNEEITEQIIFFQSSVREKLNSKLVGLSIPNHLLIKNFLNKEVIENIRNKKIMEIESKVMEQLKVYGRGIFDDFIESNQESYKELFLFRLNLNMIKLLNTWKNSEDKAIEIEGFLNNVFDELLNALKDFEKKHPQKGMGIKNYNSDYQNKRNGVIYEMVNLDNWNKKIFEYLNTQDEIFKEIYIVNYRFFNKLNTNFKFTSNGIIIKNVVYDKELVNLLLTNNHSFLEYTFFTYDWIALSSGEKALLGIFSRIFSIKNEIDTKNITFLFDEPECFLHPEWQRLFIKLLIIFFNSTFEDSSIQLILTSHSPFVASDLPRENVIMLDTYEEKDNEVKNKEQEIGNCKVVNDKDIKTFGANIFDLYTDAFFVTSSFGEFAKGKIKEVVELLTYNEKINDSTKKIEKIYDEDKIKVKKEEIEYIINSIGEKLVKNKLQKMYDEYREWKLKDKDLLEEFKNLSLEEQLKIYKIYKNGDLND